MPYEMRTLDVKFCGGTIRFSSDPKSRHSQIARPMIFFEHPNQRDDQAELCQLKKFCLSSERGHVFRQFAAGNYVL